MRWLKSSEPHRDSYQRKKNYLFGYLQRKTNVDVSWFWIKDQPLDDFPKKYHEKFPNLKYLFIKGCGLKKISKTDLVGLENFELLELGGNELKIFADMKRLKVIGFKTS